MVNNKVSPGMPGTQWPAQGHVEFKDVSLVYRPGLPPAVRHVSFTLKGGQRTGVVGRTGAGKSSLVVLLFRICEPSTGSIHIDGREIQKLGLQTLRRAMSIIPQHPLLMQGTVRINLDPFQSASEQELQSVMEKIGLPLKFLDKKVGGGANDLSAGQCQLLSFGRTLLSKAKLIVMDEPTSNIDFQTDESIQRVVREEFTTESVITIAHRLNTIIDYDQILVMGEGLLLEKGRPIDLLKNPKSELSGMADSLGKTANSKLLNKALTRRISLGDTDVEALHESLVVDQSSSVREAAAEAKGELRAPASS